MPGRIHRRNQWLPWFALAGAVLLYAAGWWLEEAFLVPTGWQRPAGQLATGEYLVERVVDGDTIVLNFNDLRVRLQGVDTPETVQANTPVEAWGPEATAFTEAFLESADWRVKIVVDGEPVDRYGRHLGFLWHGDRLLNEELIREGLARATTGFDFSESMKQRLIKAQISAQTAGLGIWAKH